MSEGLFEILFECEFLKFLFFTVFTFRIGCFEFQMGLFTLRFRQWDQGNQQEFIDFYDNGINKTFP